MEWLSNKEKKKKEEKRVRKKEREYERRNYKSVSKFRGNEAAPKVAISIQEAHVPQSSIARERNSALRGIVEINPSFQGYARVQARTL